MSFNRSLLTQITKDLEKKKKPSKPKVPRNQWQHPGEITNIPSNNITMDGVSYPVLGVPNVGQPQMMYPDQQYNFPGADNVTEYPEMQFGGLWDSNRTAWVDSVNNANMNKNFVQRMYNPNGPQMFLPGSKKPSTHFMESGDGRAYPTVVQRPGNKYVEWMNQNNRNGAYNYAADSGQYIQFPNDVQASWYAENGYKQGTNVVTGKKKMQPGGQTIAYGDNTRVGAVPRHGRSYQRPPQNYDGFLKAADIATDVMQLGHFIPTPVTQGIAFAGDFFGAGIDSYQALEEALKGNYGAAGVNAASAFLPSYLKSAGYLRDMHNAVPGSTAAKIANLGSKDGSYRPLTALPRLMNNAAVKKGIAANRSVAGALGAETYYDQHQQGGQTIKPGEARNFIQSWNESPMAKRMLANSVEQDDPFGINYLHANDLRGARNTATRDAKVSILSPAALQNQLRKEGEDEWHVKNTAGVTGDYQTKENPLKVFTTPSNILNIIDERLRPYDIATNANGIYSNITLNNDWNEHNVNQSLVHELSHSSDFSGDLIPYSDIDKMKRYAAGKTNTNFKRYVADPTETRARLNNFRYNAKNQGLYDPFTQKINLQQLQKYKQTNNGYDPLDQLRYIYNDKQITDMLNTISYMKKNQGSEQAYARYGGAFNRYQDGGQQDEAWRAAIMQGTDKALAAGLKGAKWIGKNVFGTEDIVPDVAKDFFFNRIRPVSYPNDLRQVAAEIFRSNRAKPTKDLQGDLSMDEEAWSRVLNRPTKSKYFVPSQHRPTSATDPSAQYYQMAPGVINEDLMKRVLTEHYFRQNGRKNSKGQTYVPMQTLKPFMSKQFMNDYKKYANADFEETDPLANFQVYQGKDPKTGKPYLSISDTYDFGLESANELIKPMNIYHRVYGNGGYALGNYQTGGQPVVDTAPVEYTGSSIVDYLQTKGFSGSKQFRKQLAEDMGIQGYNYSAKKNLELLNKLKEVEDLPKGYTQEFTPLEADQVMALEKERGTYVPIEEADLPNAQQQYASQQTWAPIQGKVVNQNAKPAKPVASHPLAKNSIMRYAAPANPYAGMFDPRVALNNVPVSRVPMPAAPGNFPGAFNQQAALQAIAASRGKVVNPGSKKPVVSAPANAYRIPMAPQSFPGMFDQQAALAAIQNAPVPQRAAAASVGRIPAVPKIDYAETAPVKIDEKDWATEDNTGWNPWGLGPVSQGPIAGSNVNRSAYEAVADDIQGLWDKATSWYDRNSAMGDGKQERKVKGIDPKKVAADPIYVTGDTIPDKYGRYHIPEVMDLNYLKFGTRNRGDYTPIDTEAGSITAFKPFENAKTYFAQNNDAPNSTYMGVGPDGKIKVGNRKDFEGTDIKISKTFSNKIVDFNRNPDGSIVKVKSNPKASKETFSPSVKVLGDDGKIVDGKMSLLLPKSGNQEESFDLVTGGRYIMQTPNGKLEMVSGSLKNIEERFKKLKQGNPYVNVITLDNGSYSRGIRTNNQKLTAKDLKRYDNQNTEGGNFAYLLPDAPKTRYDIKFNEFESAATQRLQKLYPGKKVEVKFENDGVYDARGSRDIESQAKILKKGYSQAPISMHNFDAARDYGLFVDGKRVDANKQKDIYKKVLWDAADKTGMHHLEDWDVVHIGLAKEGQKTAFDELFAKYPDIFASGNFKKSIAFLEKNKNNPAYKEAYQLVKNIKPFTGQPRSQYGGPAGGWLEKYN